MLPACVGRAISEVLNVTRILNRDIARRPGSRIFRAFFSALFGCVLLSGVPIFAGCAGSGASSRYRALAEQWRDSAPDSEALEDAADLFASSSALDRVALVHAVLERNPTLTAARYAWRAALARYPQVTSLDDPLLGFGVAPLSFGSNHVDGAYQLEVNQKFPFPGKLALRGEIALAEAQAAAHDFEAVRLRLAAMTSLLFDEYYLLERSLEINAEHLALLAEFQQSAVARYEVGEASQQDPLQAEVELAHATHREVELRTERRVAAQQINALLHRHPDSALPPPPAQLLLPELEAFDREQVLATALEKRPELRAADARVHARESATELTRREFWPDFSLSAMYDAFWQEGPLKPLVGMALNLPLRLGFRRGALEEAQAELSRVRSERESLADEVRFSVESSFERLAEARHLLHLHRERLLPAARDQVTAARAGFETGRNNFLTLIEAERNLRNVELAYAEAQVNVSRRSTELKQAVGLIPALTETRRTP